MATIIERHFNFTARFYEKGNYDGAPDHTLTSLIISTATDGVIAGLSNLEPTKIEFIVNGSATLPDRVRVIAFQSFAPNNAQKYDANLFRGRTENHVTNAGATTIDGILKNPSIKSQAGAATTISFHVDNTLINLGETYYFQIIVADSTNNLYTTYITGELTVIEPPPQPIVPLLTDQSLRNYNKLSLGSCIALAPERLKSLFTIDTATYNTDVNAAYGTALTYADFLQDIIFKVYDNVTGELLYTKNRASGEITEVIGGVSANFSHTFRLKHDAANDWQGRTLRINWEQRFFYPKAVTGLSQDHIDHIYLNQFAVVGTLTPSNGTNMKITNAAGHVISSLCGVDEITVTVQGVNGKNLIAFIDSFQYSADKILEEESYVSAQGLTQLFNTKLFAVATTYAGGQATFKVLVSELQNNTQYRVYGLALLV